MSTSYPAPQNFETPPGTILEIEFILDDLRVVLPHLNEPFDLVFHDPFSPQHIPELWTVELFREYYRLLQPSQGRLLTYSAAAAVRGGLQEAGFILGRTVGVGDKTGGTAAWIPSVSGKANAPELPDYPPEIQPLSDWERDYLNSRAGLPYRDPGLRQTRDNILHCRQNEQAGSSRPSGAALLKNKPQQTG